MPRNDKIEPSYFDVGYGIASVALTLGAVVVATTSCDYHGVAILATSAGATVKIYDSTGTSAGNLLDVFSVPANTSYRTPILMKLKARLGIVALITNGTASDGTLFFTPKG